MVLAGACFMLCAQVGLGLAAGRAETISALEARRMLDMESQGVFLVDVRTRAQYTLLGHPAGAYNAPWRLGANDFQVKGGPYGGGKAAYTGYQLSAAPNPDFVGVMQSLFKPEDRLIIISTSGPQGGQAAEALVQAGFKRVFNIRHGFLGDVLTSPDQEKLAEKYSPRFGRRGLVNGWVRWGLPVSYSIDPRLVYPPDIKRMEVLK